MRYLILLFFLSSPYVFAQDYYWKVTRPNNSSITWGMANTPEAACIAATSAADEYTTDASNFVFSHTVFISPTRYFCRWNVTTSGGGSSYTQYYVNRYGSTCPSGTAYNETTGICDPDECKAKEGQTTGVSKSGLKNDSFLTVTYSATLKRNFYNHSPLACVSGCAVDIARSLKCTLDTAGQYRCGGSGTYNGTSCSSENPSADPDPNGTDPVPQEKTIDEPCIYGTVNGVTSCVSRKKIDTEGLFGDSQGACSNPAGCPGADPKSNETKIDTQVTNDPQPNGDTKTTKTDTKTTTICQSSDTNCTVTTTTKTTTTTTNGNGTVTSTTGVCSGPDCSSNTNPDADGDGWGDCVGDDCGDGNGGSTVNGEDCGVPLACEGDAIQCAILRQEKENNCKWMLGPDEEAAVVAQVSGEGFQLEENSVDTSSFFTDAINQGRWLSSGCPSPRTISVMGTSVTFSWQPICDFAVAMAPIIVAMASLFFALFVFRGIKGN